MNLISHKKIIIVILLILLGIFLRYLFMTFGHNYDFDSYCIVGELVTDFKNVYAETERYNYGPIFFCIQGLLFAISKSINLIFHLDFNTIYRIAIVTALTLTDLGITFFIAKRYSLAKAMIFFLNPISIYITGYHNQFDNMAILLGLISIIFYNEDKKFNKNDLLFVLFFTLSLITKHILCFLPLFILLKKNLPIKKKILYAFIPPMLFLLSFVPFALQSPEALQGIKDNVFLYKSFNNAPLLIWLFNLVQLPSNLYIIAFGLEMLIIAFIVRSREFKDQLLIYLIAMVAFSSAVVDQYLAIPLVALCCFDNKFLKYIYMVLGIALLSLNGFNGAVSDFIVKTFSSSTLNFVVEKFQQYGYNILVWILLIILVYELISHRIKVKEELKAN
jgi:hypothetical protein